MCLTEGCKYKNIKDSSYCRRHIPICQALTALGKECSANVKCDGKYCARHKNYDEKVKITQEKMMKKTNKKETVIKVSLEHNHKPGEHNEFCKMCDEFGDIFDPCVTDIDFEIINRDIEKKFSLIQ